MARSTGERALDRAFKVIAANELPLSEIELRIALEQLTRTQGSISDAAKLLGVNRRTLQRKLKRGFKRQRTKSRHHSRRSKVAEVAILRSRRGRRGATNGVQPPSVSNRVQHAARETLLTSVLAKKVLSAVQGAKGGLSTIDLAKKLSVPKAQVKRITHGFKRKGTFKVKGIKRQATYHFTG